MDELLLLGIMACATACFVGTSEKGEGISWMKVRNQRVQSEGQAPPQPVGATKVSLKVAPKATAILFCKALQTFTLATMWQGFMEKPQNTSPSSLPSTISCA